MPRRPAPDQLAVYRQQQVEIARKIKAAETRKRAQAKQDEVRRRLVLGAAALDYFRREDQRGNCAGFLQAMFKDRKLSAADLALFKDLLRPPAAAPD